MHTSIEDRIADDPHLAVTEDVVLVTAFARGGAKEPALVKAPEAHGHRVIPQRLRQRSQGGLVPLLGMGLDAEHNKMRRNNIGSVHPSRQMQ